ncbi:ATP-binding cassette domain-containing protein [Brevibacterium sp. Marseille-P9724]|uniref:ATP-binding cassette domain-containing protein n=1 Tax=Brevibacterium sp. Marseille-P9724 TaxID=2614125 RepID=UPI00125F6B3C|nr:ATP-binding cassette domain-containing protein [Brevibacterium sp. Marseille-P9724]
MTSDVVLTVEGLTVKHGSQTALDDFSFTLQRGEILGIVGANGAGKSTLLKVLSGGIIPDEGTITLADEKFAPETEAEARAIGVGYIPQRISVDEDQTVYHAMFRTSYLSKLTDEEKRAEATRLLEDNGVAISADEQMRDLVQAERTMVEILRLANEETALILLDEVSASFNDHEISLVHDLIIRLSKQGRAIIYVSHRLDELQSLSNRIAVIRDGRLRSILVPREADRDTITVEIFDTEAPVPTKKRGEIGDEILRFEDVALDDKLSPTTFSLHKGEIFGITGLRRSGVEQLADIISGKAAHTSGTIVVNGEEKSFSSPEDALRAGIFTLGETDGQVDYGEGNNLASEYSKIDEDDQSFTDQVQSFRELVSTLQELRVKTPSIHRKVGELSGGDQQKLAVAKSLHSDANIFVLNQPTRGVDELSRQAVYKLLEEVTSRGSACVLLSSDISELLALSDRVAVMRENRLIGPHETDSFTEDTIMMIALGYTPFRTTSKRRSSSNTEETAEETTDAGVQGEIE